MTPSLQEVLQAHVGTIEVVDGVPYRIDGWSIDHTPRDGLLCLRISVYGGPVTHPEAEEQP